MQESIDTRIESDKNRIVQMAPEEDWKSVSSRMKNRCCSNKYYLVLLILSLVTFFMVLSTIFAVAIRWKQMEDQIHHLTVSLGSFEMKSTAASIAQAQKAATTTLPHESSTTTTTATTATSVGSTYTRWGKSGCPSAASLVYSGFSAGSAAGTRTRGGGGAEYLCMPSNPEYNKYDSTGDSAAHSWIYSTEFFSFDLDIFDASVSGHNVPCSVCHAQRSAKVMIPGKRSCPLTWTKEYEGYLMSGHVADMKSSYVCVDANPDVIGGTQNITGGSSLYFVSGFCGTHGGLSYCNDNGGYVIARELTCVVCTK